MKGLLGVEPLDAMLGKVPKGARILIHCPPDVDGRALLLQSTRHALRDDQSVVYVVTDRAPSTVRRALARLGQTGLDHLHFIDAYSGQLGAPEDHPLMDRGDIGSLVAAVQAAGKQHPKALLCIESISSLVEAAGSGFLSASDDLLKAIRSYHASLSLYVDWPSLPDVDAFLSAFDAGLQFYGIEDRIIRNNALKVDHLSWSKKPDLRPRLVTVRPDGGVRVLVPKVAVTGPDNAGKTTFVHSLSHAAVGTERMQTTVALDKGRYETEGTEAELFGTPGDRRFDPIINTIIEQAAAVVLLVDSTDESSFPRAQDLLQRVQRRGLKVVVAANKQDQKNAISAEELEDRLAFPTVPCTAIDRDSARAVMDLVLEGVLPEAMP